MSTFFMPPDDLQLDELTNATLMKLEQFRDRTATGQLHIHVQTSTITFQALSRLSDEHVYISVILISTCVYISAFPSHWVS